jgi:hydrogenase maturation protein HypF
MLWELAPKNINQFKDLASLQEFSATELKLMEQIMDKEVNSARTSSVGRLFDGVASLLGLCHTNIYEGQAAMLLEFACEEFHSSEYYPFTINQKIIDWVPMIEKIIHECRSGTSTAYIATKFHNTLVEMATQVCLQSNQQRIVLSGGCFQNKYLTERLIKHLKEKGFSVFWHQLIPPNDGGIALGQAAAAGEMIKFNKSQQENTLKVTV